jgi:hypothetical protein
VTATLTGKSAHDEEAREQVVAKLRRWHELYPDETPGLADFDPWIARHRGQEWKAERFALGDPETGEPWPSSGIIKRYFDGSLTRGLEAAGMATKRRPALPSDIAAVEEKLSEAKLKLAIAATERGQLQMQVQALEAELHRQVDEQRREQTSLRERLRLTEYQLAQMKSGAGEHMSSSSAPAPLVRLPSNELAALNRPNGPAGRPVLQQALNKLKEALRAGGKQPLDDALAEIATAAESWRRRL